MPSRVTVVLLQVFNTRGRHRERITPRPSARDQWLLQLPKTKGARRQERPGLGLGGIQPVPVTRFASTYLQGTQVCSASWGYQTDTIPTLL